MAGTAKLRIDADAADVQKAFGAATSAAKKAAMEMLTAAKKSNDEQAKSLRKLQAEHASMANKLKRVSEQSERRRAAMEGMVTRKLKSESDKRYQIEEAGTKKVAGAYDRLFKVHARVEQMRTAKTLAEIYKRIQAEDRAYEHASRRRGGGGRGDPSNTGNASGGNYRSRYGQMSFNAAGAVRDFAGGIHGQVQGARQSRAQTTRTLNQALGQTGANARTEAPALRERVYQFSQQSGIDENELAQGLLQAQSRHSALTNADGSDTSASQRSAALEEFFTNAQLAQDTGQDVGEVATFAAMLRQNGVTGFGARSGGAGRQALMTVTGLANQGGVEVSDLIRQGIGPMMRRMSTATSRLGPNATPEQLNAARTQSIFQTVAEMEVGAALGESPTVMGNRAAQADNIIRRPNIQRKMLTNIREAQGLTAEQRTFAENTLFEGTGSNRHLRTEYANSPYDLARGFQTAFHGNTEQMQNTLAGTGLGGKHGQGLSSPLRNYMTALMGGGGAGTEHDRIRQLLRNANTVTTEDTLNNTHELFNDPLAALNRNANASNTALTDETNPMVSASNRVADAMAHHPFTSQLFDSLGGNFGAGFLSRIGNFQWGGGGGGGGGAGSVASGLATSGAITGAGGALATAFSGALALGGALSIGLSIGEGLRTAVDGFAETFWGRAPGTHAYGAGNEDSVTNGNTWSYLWDQISQRINGERIQNNNPTAHGAGRGSEPAINGVLNLPISSRERVADLTSSGPPRLGGPNSPIIVQLDLHTMQHIASSVNSQSNAGGEHP